MGILDELIILVKESLDDARERQGGGNSGGNSGGTNERRPETTHRSGEELENMRRALARRALLQREAAQRDQSELTQSNADAAQARQAAEKARRQALLVQPTTASVANVAVTDLSAGAFQQLLRQPHVMRQMILMKEILDKPLALRQRRK
jgi:hypothetical protein